MNCQCIDLDLVDYKKAYAIQKKYIARVKAAEKDEYLLFVEHNNTFTLGTNAKWKNLLIGRDKALSLGIEVVENDRGGDITYHGPGQLVVYPIFNLAGHYKDIHRFLRDLEEVTIRTLAEFSISSFRYDGRPGVWTEKGKICSVGIGVSRWVSYHGLALNANTDLKYFRMINPCGFNDIKVTSMKSMLKKDIDMEELKTSMREHFGDVFNLSITTPS